MARVLLAFADVGMAVPLQEELEGAGHEVRWNAAEAAGPADGDVWADAALLTSADGANALADAVQAFRDATPPPALILIGTGGGDEALATKLQIAYQPSTAGVAELTAAIEHAIKVRYAGGLRASSPLHVALRALGLAGEGERMDMALRLLAGARTADVDMVREALRWYAPQYVTVDPRWVQSLRQHRALQIPEVEFTPQLDGTRSLQTVLRSGGKLDAWGAARFVWAMASIGAVAFTPGPPDQSNSARRRLGQTRFHLEARRERLRGATYYDVLELTPQAADKHIERAVQMLAIRYSPDITGRLDLSELTSLAGPTWEQILKARKVLLDPAERGRYHRWLEQQPSVRTEWASGQIRAQEASAMMQRGQSSLVDGDVFKAVSDMAAACRLHPHHPDYEASLAWARYRAEASRDKEDRAVLARREREIAEASLAGHRPWPRALLALGLLCVAEGDADAARWHLREALTCDPNLPAAQQMLARISGRRAPTGG